MHRNRPLHLILALLLLIALPPAPAQSPVGQEKAIDVLGQRLHYVEAGSGPAVVLLHGLGADSTTWLPTLPALAPHFHVYALDQIGFGQSDKPMIPYRPRTLVDFLTGFLDQLGIEKATLVAIRLPQQHPLIGPTVVLPGRNIKIHRGISAPVGSCCLVTT